MGEGHRGGHTQVTKNPSAPAGTQLPSFPPCSHSLSQYFIFLFLYFMATVISPGFSAPVGSLREAGAPID